MVVVVRGTRVVVTIDELEVVDREVVVVVRLVVDVVEVDAKSSGWPPFRRPKGSLAPEAGLPARVGAAQVGHSTRFCFVLST